MEKTALKEVREHGTANFPCAFYIWEKNKKGMHAKHHWHNQLELIYFQKGEFKVEINMDKYIIDEECFCFINSEELHSIKSDYPCRESAMVFDLKMLSFDMFDSVQSQLIHPLLTGQIKMPRFIYRKEKCCEDIYKEYIKILEIYKSQEGKLVQGTGRNIIENIALQMKIKASILNILAIIYEKTLNCCWVIG